jgi:hypothetical protein
VFDLCSPALGSALSGVFQVGEAKGPLGTYASLNRAHRSHMKLLLFSRDENEGFVPSLSESVAVGANSPSTTVSPFLPVMRAAIFAE